MRKTTSHFTKNKYISNTALGANGNTVDYLIAINILLTTKKNRDQRPKYS
ncbi:hypothetical protein [Niabella hibiscisoli]|nr:hypothetical protein [Niabella hibiscisoli]MCH5715579.1 hypothetical protein [Niabella hibiscisoli]